uniref:Uncharacterized protein n=1 Tax=Daucus carota subsp. sativus TaxID=79200 RepID=A0A166HR54_DAUCS
MAIKIPTDIVVSSFKVG